MQKDRKRAEISPQKQIKYDLLLAGGVLLAALALYLLLRPGGKGAWAVVTVDGTETARYSLDQDLEVTIGQGDYNVLRIQDGSAAVVEANCGDQTCLRMGEISREGETIVCLPHRLVISVEGGNAVPYDAVTG